MPKYVVTPHAPAAGMMAGVRNPGPGGTMNIDRLSAEPFVARGWLRLWGAPIEARAATPAPEALEPPDDPPPFDPPFTATGPAQVTRRRRDPHGK